jgi:hypothetical protein
MSRATFPKDIQATQIGTVTQNQVDRVNNHIDICRYNLYLHAIIGT